MNKELKIATLKQACEDIKSKAEEFVGSTEYNNYFSIEIEINENESPTITINKQFPVTFTKEMEDIISKKGID